MHRLARFFVLPAAVAVLSLAACGDDAEPVARAEPADELTTADAVADAVLARYDANLGAVDTVSIFAGGVEAQYVASGDSLDPFGRPEIRPTGDAPVPPARAQVLANQLPNLRRLARGLRAAELVGTVTRDGRRAYLLRSADSGVLIGEPGTSAMEPGVENRLYVDAETFDLLEVYRGLPADSGGVAVTGRIIYSDFRTTDGVTLPFAVREVTSGLAGAMDDDTRMVMGGRLGLEQQQLEAQPASAERDARLDEVRAELRLLNEGILETEVRVDSVRISGAR